MSRVPFALAAPTFVENWPPAVAALAIPATVLPLAADEALALGAAMAAHGHRFRGADPRAELRLRGRLRDAFRPYAGHGAFVRLGSRSPKDGLAAQRFGLRAATPDAVWRLLTGGSARLADDLETARRHDHGPSVILRPWLEIPPWAEIRCFLRGRALVGLSQYDCVNHPPFRELAANAAAIGSAARAFVARLAAVLPMEDVIADIVLRPENAGWSAVLLDLNPFHPAADWCLFAAGDFDGGFRFLGDLTPPGCPATRNGPPSGAPPPGAP